MRADRALVERGLAPSRTAAQALIAGGQVTLTHWSGTRQVAKPSESVPEQATLTVNDGDALRFVSRAGLKLEAALARAHNGQALAVSGVWLDLGISTGGFTDCLLRSGATHIVGVDVGHAQLHPRLALDPRLTHFEGINARDLYPEDLGEAWPTGGFAGVVADLSFISLTLVLAQLPELLVPDGWCVLMVKPQFEAGRDALNDRGLVRDPAQYPVIQARVIAAAAEAGLWVQDYFESSLLGGDGNREFFLVAQNRPDQAPAAHLISAPIID